ncbi:MAG: phosphatidate cytidylyltransferase [Muribaculaceae bacterium]|nr:phosphatidate cytidylyltransferase [Muribaculaceae bacterium]
MKNLITRSLAGIVYVGVILAAILSCSYGIAALGLIFALLAAVEFQNLCCGKAASATEKSNRFLGTLGTLGCYSLTLIPFSAFSFCANTSAAERAIFILFPCLVVAGATAAALRFLTTIYDKEEGALRRLAFTVMGWVYIGLPLGCMAILRESAMGWRVPLMLFVMIWLNDTGAYCVGSLCGRRKLFERLSPKKSWEGFWGGMAFSVIAGIVYAILTYARYSNLEFGIFPATILSKGAYIAIWAGIGAAISAAATLGDLFESLIKRTLGVKDSGKLIPGHGGILDRIDSLLFAAPVMLVLCICIFG